MNINQTRSVIQEHFGDRFLLEFDRVVFRAMDANKFHGLAPLLRAQAALSADHGSLWARAEMLVMQAEMNEPIRRHA